MFLIGILGQTFSKSLIVLNFRINQQKIAATLCVNRFKPKSCCHGKCYLTKQLKTHEKSQDTPLNNGSGFKFDVLFYSEKKTTTPYIIIQDQQTVYTARYLDPVTQTAIAAIFHPPQC